MAPKGFDVPPTIGEDDESGGGGFLLSPLVDIPISTDEADWDNSDGAFVFNPDGTVDCTDTLGKAELVLPAAARMAAFACILAITGTVHDGPTGTDARFGIAKLGQPDSVFSLCHELFLSGNDDLTGVLFENYLAELIGFFADYDVSPVGEPTEMVAQTIATASTWWVNDDPLGSAIGIPTSGGGFPPDGQDLVTVVAKLCNSGNAGLTFDLNTARLLVPALPVLT